MKKRNLSILLVAALFLTFVSVFSLPVSAETSSGTFGSSVTWTIDLETGVLVIEGSGCIETYDTAEDIPWLEDTYRTAVTEVRISDGITGIGEGIFLQCTALAAVDIPESVARIGTDAFGGCTALTALFLPNPDCVIAASADTLGVPGATHICGAAGSTAQAYAKQYGYAFGHEYDEEGMEPTCTEPGYFRYVCTWCGSAYQEELKALGHDWETPAYEWADDNGAVTASRVCGRDKSHTESETVSTGYQVTREPTEELEGEGLYTAVFANPAFSPQTKTVAIPRLEPTCPFVDVRKIDWFYDAVIWAVRNGITGGIDATHFGPKKNCTREQVVTFLWAANGSPAPQSTSNPFADVKKSKYFYRAVLWAVEKGITGGVDDTHFGVGVRCTRAQVVMFLWAAAGRPAPETNTNPFTDVKKKDYYYKAVLWAVENGITGGTTLTTFSPKTVCNRAQVVTFLYAAYAEKS